MRRQPQDGLIEDDPDRPPVPHTQAETSRRGGSREYEQDCPTVALPGAQHPRDPARQPAQRPHEQQLLGRHRRRPRPPRRACVWWRRKPKRTPDRRLTWLEPAGPVPGRCRVTLQTEPVIGGTEIVPVRGDRGLELGPASKSLGGGAKSPALVELLRRRRLRRESSGKQNHGQARDRASPTPTAERPPQPAHQFLDFSDQRGVLFGGFAGTIPPRQKLLPGCGQSPRGVGIGPGRPRCGSKPSARAMVPVRYHAPHHRIELLLGASEPCRRRNDAAPAAPGPPGAAKNRKRREQQNHCPTPIRNHLCNSSSESR